MGEKNRIPQRREKRRNPDPDAGSSGGERRHRRQAIAARFFQYRNTVAEPDVIEAGFVGKHRIAPERFEVRRTVASNQMAGVKKHTEFQGRAHALSAWRVVQTVAAVQSLRSGQNRQFRSVHRQFDPKSKIQNGSLLHLEPRLAFGHVIERFRMNNLTAVKNHSEESFTSGDSMSDASRDDACLTGFELKVAPFGVIQRVSAKLEPGQTS